MSSSLSLYFSALGGLAQVRHSRDERRWPERLRGLMGAPTWLHAPTHTPSVAITVIRSTRVGYWRIRRHGQPDTEPRGQPFIWLHEDALLQELEWRLYATSAVESLAPLLIHAGAVVRDGQALLLPGVSGAGKTTLTYALAARGWQTLSDDLLALDAEPEDPGGALLALPCPRCGHVNTRSLRLVAELGVTLEGPVAGLVGYHRPHAWGEPAPVRYMIAPRYEAGAASVATPMTQAETAALLMKASFAQRRVKYPAQWRAAIQVAAPTRGWRLTYGQLVDALDTIERLVAEWPKAAEVSAEGEK
jgi:hypothetical protein